MKSTKIGFVGTGVMGVPMVHHLLNAGHELVVSTRTKVKALPLLEHGAVWANTPAELASQVDVVMTMVGFPSDVEEVYFGETGIFAGIKQGMLIIDLTTTTPDLAVKIDRKAKELGVMALDAPVSGGDIGAQKGALTIMVGGEMEAYNRALPYLSCFGKMISLQGGAGAGQHTKMANQIAIAGALGGVAEAIAYATKVGLAPTKVLEAIGGGAAASWQLANNGPKMLAGDYAPGFFIKHYVKDLKIALAGAKQDGLDLVILRHILEAFVTLEANNMGELGTQAIIEHYQSEVKRG